MENEEIKKPRRKKVKNVYHHHLTIWVYPYEWDKLQYLASGAGKTVSRYICDKALMYKGKVPPNILRDKTQGSGKIKPLSFEEKEYDTVMEKVRISGQGVTQYLLNIALGEE